MYLEESPAFLALTGRLVTTMGRARPSHDTVKGALWLLGLRFLPALITKSPIVLESEGLGPRPYDGRIVLLVDRHTASAAEMVTIFAKENKLAKHRKR